MGDKERGLYGKFHVARVDGSSAPGGKHFGCKYFVLDLTHDKFAVNAIRAYASACNDEYPHLAEDLRKWLAEQDGNDLPECFTTEPENFPDCKSYGHYMCKECSQFDREESS